MPNLSIKTAMVQGWQGVQTIPRVVTYDADLDELVFYPVAELEQLRNETLYQGAVTLNQVNPRQSYFC